MQSEAAAISGLIAARISLFLSSCEMFYFLGLNGQLNKHKKTGFDYISFDDMKRQSSKQAQSYDFITLCDFSLMSAIIAMKTHQIKLFRKLL